MRDSRSRGKHPFHEDVEAGGAARLHEHEVALGKDGADDADGVLDRGEALHGVLGEAHRAGGLGHLVGKLAPDEHEPVSSDIVYRFPGGKYIYAMSSSECGMDDPEILSTPLAWAKEHGYQVRGPIQVDYFFRIKQDDRYRYFYAITIPFADCDIKVNS